MVEDNSRNHMHLCFDARSCNESFARMAVTAFLTDMNPTLEQVADVKMAVSEAVTNAIVHGYSDENKQVEIVCDRQGRRLVVTVIDHGIGMADVEKAMQPFYTSRPEMERSGMGFSFMEAFMDDVKVESQVGIGTKVIMSKYIRHESSPASIGRVCLENRA